ncbi:alpha/beta hydrolase [Rhabdothermincola salaria]|uniref:alpha/beta hydrolase n=1 Tax=Rhabdothermincola salaria TaxID=2903142 RepID=UPI001E3CA8A0|nr:alpha/beta hydrolase [Rhabdothermincola salaria]MCD9625554.1 alpha/beta hydrolase [Rhabdothermincola salaria]
MASDEFHALAERMAAAPPPPPDETVEQQRARIDATMSQLPLADGVEAVETTVGGVAAIECRPGDLAPDAPVVLYVHGGGFRIASALAYRAYTSHLAAVIDARVVSIDYRLAPEHAFPAALDDTVAAYVSLLDEGVPAGRIVVAGDSAGGGLAASLVPAARQRGLALPAGTVCCSPWVDLTVTAASYVQNADVDRLFSAESASLAAGLYLAGHDPTDPLASPVFADWAGAPPMLIQVGDVEVLLDDALRLAATASDAGVDVTLTVAPEMPHIWPMSYPAFPEAVEAVEEIAAFVHRVTSP